MKKVIGNILISVGISMIICLTLFSVGYGISLLFQVELTDRVKEGIRVAYILSVLVSSIYIYEATSDETE